MGIEDLLLMLGGGVSDPEEESFLLFSQTLPSQDLGFVDSKAYKLELTIAGKDLLINQSPTILSSNRAAGTTGAVTWKISPLFAEWIASPQNVLFRLEILNRNSTVLELGCGISGVVALTLGPCIGKYVATDQEYALKLLKQNIAENSSIVLRSSQRIKNRADNMPRKAVRAACNSSTGNIQIMALDWELNSLSTLPELLNTGVFHVGGSVSGGVDAVVACDCIYNEALIEPLVKTCVDICRLRPDSPENNPTLCIVAQQLRSSDVFEAWLLAFHQAFHVWRVPDDLLTEGLKENSGFVVHIGILRS
ncbi:MAG: hypothetical protein M1830_002745 [Pleopsidium flavum]|nr:MAG: hypothetical protein M1830_002745 [Pleopsidium flavum]